jgi:required for meiotic nuclear division protein 1
MLRIEAYLIARQINIKKFKSDFLGRPFSASSSELFYVQEHDKYLYVLSYGVVGFAGYNDVEKSDFIKFLKNYCSDPINGESDFKEDLLVVVNPEHQLTFNFNSLIIPELNANVVRIIVLNIAQSVAMDYYEQLGYDILEGTRNFTEELEKYGRIRVSKKNLLRFIGRTLNVKNNIVDNLYVFNSPDIVWEHEYLTKLDRGLRDTFDINMRFRELDYELRIVQENLTVITEILQHRESSRLEWIIIILILVEVIDLFVSKIIGL